MIYLFVEEGIEKWQPKWLTWKYIRKYLQLICSSSSWTARAFDWLTIKYIFDYWVQTMQWIPNNGSNICIKQRSFVWFIRLVKAHYCLSKVEVWIEFGLLRIIIQHFHHHNGGARYPWVGVLPHGWAFDPHMGQDAHFWPKIIISFYFFNIIYFSKKISAYREFDELLVIDHFQGVSSITPTQVMVYHWWIPCETLVHTGSR